MLKFQAEGRLPRSRLRRGKEPVTFILKLIRLEQWKWDALAFSDPFRGCPTTWFESLQASFLERSWVQPPLQAPCLCGKIFTATVDTSPSDPWWFMGFITKTARPKARLCYNQHFTWQPDATDSFAGSLSAQVGNCGRRLAISFCLHCCWCLKAVAVRSWWPHWVCLTVQHTIFEVVYLISVECHSLLILSCERCHSKVDFFPNL